MEVQIADWREATALVRAMRTLACATEEASEAR
jgi:hypothetical protein